MITAVGRWCFDHRGRTVLGWFVALGVIFGAAAALGPAFGATSGVPDSDSADGVAVLDEYFPQLGAGGTSGTIVFRADQGVDDPEVTAAMETLFAQVNAGFPDASGQPEHPGATVLSPYSEQGQGQIAYQGDRAGRLAGRLAFASVNLAADVDDTEAGLIGEAIMENAPQLDGLEVLAGGQYLAVVEPPQTELIGVAFAIVVLILAFGSVLAMGLPIAVAV
ncbi:MAG: MMPL family transporter, partial [Acidimicrobiia bacterium]|nr:MMPL family transporter [Acidimicrobiia bacterium]